MSLEERILQIVKEETSDGKLDDLFRTKFQAAIESAVDDVFKSYGSVVDKMEKEIKAAMIPVVENVDYSEFVMKMDHILTNVLKETTTPHRKLMENFAKLTKYEKAPETIKLSEIFEEYKKHVSSNVDTSDLEVSEYWEDGGPTYENVTVCVEVEEVDNPSWSRREEYNVSFMCEEDEDLNVSVRIKKALDREFWIERDGNDFDSIRALRHLDGFSVYLMTLSQNLTNVDMDIRYNDSDEVEVEDRPEPNWE
jgi:hypothetical protein